MKGKSKANIIGAVVGGLAFCLLVAGCDQADRKNHAANYDWAAKFCKGEANIESFDIYSTLPDRVHCTDGRRSSVP